ncbi:MAG: cyclic peptide export ABC transporter [Candidatus Methylumidiphilus sp.]
MKLLKFIEKESKASYRRIIFMAAISGLANGFLLSIINHAAVKVANGEDLIQPFLLYGAAFILFLYAQWVAYGQAISAIEESIYTVRLRLIEKIRHVELPFIEDMGGRTLYSRLTESNTILSQSAPHITSAAQVSILLVFALLYLAYISPISFVISSISMGLALALFLFESEDIRNELQRLRNEEEGYFGLINHLIEGFKEIRLSRAKSADILNHIAHASVESKDIRFEVGLHEVKLWGFGRLFTYALMPVLIFIIPSFYQVPAADIYKMTATVLFMTGPVTVLVFALPLFNRVDLAIDDLTQLESGMDAAIAKESADARQDALPFHEITFSDVCFSYEGNDNKHGFSCGPFRETIRSGELLFIIGGNGSGKSTFLKLLTGLYGPSSGIIKADDIAIDKDNCQAYRELFAAVFADFHLFDRIYGIPGLDPAEVGYWLEKMDMHHKVSFHGGGFTSTSLSGGQRKRLALIAAILERKPIVVLDEFAADQDPGFRKYFYETILKELKGMGTTVIAVTHDDHYFHVADRILKMDEGKFE